jgi:repressor LexA
LTHDVDHTETIMDETTTNPLTDRQQEVLEFVRQNAHLYGPTVREIAAALAIKSPNGVVCHLKALERKGYVRRIPGKARGLEVVT